MRFAPLAVLTAMTAVVVACTNVDNPTAPNSLAPSFGITANSGNAAWVARDTGLCGMVGSDAGGGMIFGGVGTVTHSVQNNHKVQITCKGRGIANASGAYQAYTGFACGLLALKSSDAFVTTNSEASVEANGNASMQCTWVF